MIDGVEHLLKNIHTIKREGEKAVQRGTEKAAKLLYEESQRLVPVDTGELKKSGAVHVAKMQATVTYGPVLSKTSGLDYAIFVHENPPERQRHASPTQYHFLSDPAKSLRPQMLAIMKHEVTAGLFAKTYARIMGFWKGT